MKEKLFFLTPSSFSRETLSCHLLKKMKAYMSRCIGKQTICIGENKGADQLSSNFEADQCLCFRYTDNKIPLLS